MTVTNNIYQKQIKYHVFNAVTNSELTELVPVFTTRPAFPTSVKKVHIIQKCLADMGTGITDVIGGPHDFLPPRSNVFQKLSKEISIFSNSSHFEWKVGLSDTILKGDHPSQICFNLVQQFQRRRFKCDLLSKYV
jgi:hypothetical protein